MHFNLNHFCDNQAKVHFKLVNTAGTAGRACGLVEVAPGYEAGSRSVFSRAVVHINEKWVHEDGSDGYDYKPCPVCGKLPHEDGRDACIQKIPGVTSACCGHGEAWRSVVVFENGEVIRGKEAIKFLEKWK